MLYQPNSPGRRPLFLFRLFWLISFSLVLNTVSTPQALAQAYERDVTAGGKTLLTIKNRSGRVSVIASDDEKSGASLRATSAGAPVEPGDVTVAGSEINVRERRPQDRIDLTVHLPKRSRVRIESEAGMVDVIGDFATAEVITDT